MKWLLYVLLPLAYACSPELMITDASECEKTARKHGARSFKAFRRAMDDFPAGCSMQVHHGKKIAQFVPSRRSLTKCSTHAYKSRFECVCKKAPEVRKIKRRRYV